MTDTLKGSPLSQQQTKVSFSRQDSDVSNGTPPNKEKPRKGSILKTSSRSILRKREDNFGKEIKQDSKEHQICFSEQLIEIKEVENWKKFNLDDANAGKNCCQIF